MSQVPLNIAMDYPVDWSFDRILRDLIQNFYDSIGCENFANEFCYNWEAASDGTYTLEMKTFGHSFSYEWLTYIGGSTKTDSPGKYVGMYGEGFKICVLCLVRKGRYHITMESKDWFMEPCKYAKSIEHTNVEMLGYEIENRVDDGWTKLVIEGISREHILELKEGMLNFFYPGNPLFGKKIIDKDTYAIYERSEMEIPSTDYSFDEGLLYCNFLARARLPFRVVILVKKDIRKSESRKREILREVAVIDMVCKLTNEMDALDSLSLLRIMSSYWNKLPKRGSELHSWYYVVCQLVRNISKEEYIKRIFEREITNLVYIEKRTSDSKRNKWISETEKWYKPTSGEMLVNPIFRLLGARSLVEEYLSQKRNLFREMTDTEKEKIFLLFGIAEEMIPWKLYEERPTVVIQKDENQQYDPLMFGTVRTVKKESYIRYNLKTIIMKQEDFYKDKYHMTLIKFIDILFHAYGSSRSGKVNLLLTDLGEVVIKNHKLIEKGEERWNA